jgi:general secretion pathway protein G
MKTRPSPGFTLLEVIIAMTIVVILGTVVGVQLHDLPQKGRVNAAKMQLAAFKTALELYLADNGAPPTQQQGLAALVECPAVPPVPEHYNPGGYLDATELPADPWGRPYAYFSPGSETLPYEVVCYGADGEEGGEGFNADLSTAHP